MGRWRRSTPQWGMYAFCASIGTAALWHGCGFPPVPPPEPLAVFVTADRYQLPGTPGLATTVSLQAAPFGGQPPYRYQWSVYDPSGTQADVLLDSVVGPAVRFTAGEMDGPYHVRCTVTDMNGQQYATSLVLRVGDAIGLDVSTDRLGIVVGGGLTGQATVQLNPQSGTPPFDVSWTCTGPDGTIDNDRLDTVSSLVPGFTSADRLGLYVLTATIVDAWGQAGIESAVVIVGESPGLEVVASRAALLPGGGTEGKATLLATPIGGSEPYQYDWEVIGPDGQVHNDLLWDTAIRDPIFESNDQIGTCLVRCAATDANGTVFIGSASLSVEQRISLTLTADRLTLPVGGTGAALAADVRGGREPVSIRWQVSGPGGQDDTFLLSTAEGATAIFTPTDGAGSYVVYSTATDADQVACIDSIVLTVGGAFGVAAVTDKTSLATGGIAPTGTTLLGARAYGGEAPYSYAWSVLDPSGESAPDRLNDMAIENPTFFSSQRAGPHWLLCTVIDATGAIAVDTAGVVNVGQPLNVSITTDRQSLVGGGGVSGQTQLLATINGGAAPYVYQWSVTAPNNTSDPSRLSDTRMANPVFSTQRVTGTYRLTLTTTDALGAVFVDSVELTVAGMAEDDPDQPISADVSLDRQTLTPSGDIASLTVTTVGGVSPISYAWTVTDPSGGIDNARLSSTTAPAVTFTSSAVQGTYRIRCSVTDAEGNLFIDSVQLVVSDSFHLGVTASVTHVAPGGTVELFADRTGGTANFIYNWSAVDRSGTPAGTFTTGSTGPGTASQIDTDDTVNVWTAPTGGAEVLGSYRVTVTATDANGRNFTNSVLISVSSSFLMDLTASAIHVPPGTAVDLTTYHIGGNPDFTYTWSCLNSAGTPAGTFATGSTGAGASQQVAAGDVTNTWTAPAAGAGTLGTYRIKVVATDSLGNTIADSVHVVVGSDDALILTMHLTADRVAVEPGDVVNLTADQAGGAPNFEYAWTVVNESGASTGTLGAASQTDLAGDATNTWTAPVAAAGTLGSYRIQVTVTDALGNTFTDAVHVVVQSPLSLSLTADDAFVAPGTVVTLVADRSGGEPTYDYTWQAVNSAGANAGTFTTGAAGAGAATQNNQAGDATNGWSVATEGTYTITCMVTDNAGQIFTDSVVVEVRTEATLAVQNVFLSPAAANTTGVLGATVLTDAAEGASPGQQIAAGFTNPVHPRNIVVFITDADNSITGGTARTTGLDARGLSQTEDITIKASAIDGGSSTNTGVTPFAVVTQVNLYGLSGDVDDFGADTVSVGVGTKFGLTGVLTAAADVVYVNDGGTVMTSGYTVDATSGQQGITFVNAPNGARDYIVVFLTP